MCCQTASTASATMVCSPARAARPILPRSERCSARKPPTRMTRQPPRSFRSHSENHVPIAAGQCASSKSSAVARNHTPARHQGGRQHDGTPVTPPNLAPETHLVPGWSRFAARRDEHDQKAPSDDRAHRSVLENYATNHSRHVNKPLVAPADNINRHNPLHAFPTGIAKPTRLPPWEDFQRGPQSVLAETLHTGPHRKSFTKAAVRFKRSIGHLGRKEGFRCRREIWR